MVIQSKEWEQKCSFSCINSITTNKKQMEYYTYAYLRQDGTPYYIGKGKGRRRYIKQGRTVPLPENKDKIIILKQNLTEEKAFKHEKYMIAIFGRKDLGTGILRNRTDGGDGPSGYIMSEEQKKLLSKIHSGKIFTDEYRKKISEANKGSGAGKYQRTEEILLKMKKARKLIIYELTHIDGTKLIIDSMNEFCKKNPHLDRSAMNRVGRGVTKSYKGWSVRKLEQIT